MIESGIIRPAKYPQWITNMAVVPKKNKGIRICIDFGDLNRAFPKDRYPLLNIPHVVELASGYRRLSLMDGYSRYNPISLAEEDKEHKAYFSPRGLYCYTLMPFELRNDGATYQRILEKLFAKWVHTTLEVYVDDVLVKSKESEDHVRNLKEIFDQVRKYKIK